RDVWAVGARGRRPLVEHWDGRLWRVVSTPDVGPSALYGVAALGPDDIWAVGTRQAFHFIDSGPHGALIEHWDGIRWSVVRDADPDPTEELVLLGVAVHTHDDAWAVGWNFHKKNRCIEHWYGRRWNLVDVPL